MIWKMFVVAFLAVGVIAEYKVTSEQQAKVKDMLKQYCTKNGAADKADDVEKVILNFIECGKSLFDPEIIKKEIEEAKPNGALDEVFKKYCAKSPELKTCVHTLLQGVVPCLDSTVKEHIGSATNITDQLLDFVCFKDGDRIALFIAEGGPECFQLKVNEIRECTQKIKDSVSSLDAAKALPLADQCAKYDELSTCVVAALEKCDTPTPGNMAESLFRYVRKSSPCEKN